MPLTSQYINRSSLILVMCAILKKIAETDEKPALFHM